MRVFILLIITIQLLYCASIKERYNKYFIAKPHNNDFKVTFLGVSSLLFEDKDHTILIDGFITRPSLKKLIFSKIEPNEELIKQSLKRLNIKKIDAIITLHSHHDHAMDAPLIAKLTGAKLFGSTSTLLLGEPFSLPKRQLKNIQDQMKIKIGEFTIKVIKAAHTKMKWPLNSVVGLNEELKQSFKLPAHVSAYKEGGTYALHISHKNETFFINGSTAYKEGFTKGLKANTLFLGIAKLGKHDQAFQEEYYDQTVKTLEAKRVIPIHWDDFTYTLSKPIRALPAVFDDFDKSMEFLIDKSREDQFELILMDFFDKL